VKKKVKRVVKRKSAARNGDAVLREQLVNNLKEGRAHVDFAGAIADFPADKRGVRAENLPHTAWQLLEHMRIAQWDILEFSRNRKHKSPAWPKGYWPATADPPTAAQWNASIKQFHSDLKEMEDLVANPKTDLFAKIPWGNGQTILREAFLVADHNAYHLAQILDVRRLLGAWSQK